MTTCEVTCCICNQPMDWMKRYGREGCCCTKDCHQEFEWRRTLAIMGEPYRPDLRNAGICKRRLKGKL